MPIKWFTYCLLLLSLLFNEKGMGQLGAPIINQDFGLGNEDPNTIGPPVPAGHTQLPFSNSLCPPPGSYTIARRVNVKGCFNGRWIPLSSDYTSDHIPGMDLSYMMQVNNIGFTKPQIVYTDTVKKRLCAGTGFQFSAALINLDQPANCQPFPSFPYFALTVEDDAGNVIATDTIRGVPYAVPEYSFRNYTLNFVLPAPVPSLVLKLMLLPAGNFNACGSDFAVDDIVFSAAGPKATIAFDNLPASQIVVSSCFQDNKTVSMTGKVDPFYTNTALQWQQSINNGIAWTDIVGATGYNYSNNFSVPDTFLFRLSAAEAVNISNPVCRIVSNVVKINVDGPLKEYTITSNSPVCSGADLVFNGTGANSYIWTGPNGFYDDVYYAHIYHSVLADSGMYYVTMRTAGGCYTKDSVHVTVIGTDVKAGPDTAICVGRAVQLKASAGGIEYNWSPADGLSGKTVFNPVATPVKTTLYTVTVKDKDGCSGTSSVTVTLLNTIAVKAVIEGASDICRPYDSASFKSAGTGNINSWQWNFGNGLSSSIAQPPVQYYSVNNNTGSYTVQLAVKDSAGCTDTAFHIVKVANNCYIDVPSAFTPNGDGINDFLYPLNAYKATNLLFRIFNRNGQLVFETSDWTRKWDGNINGHPQQGGAYVWMLSYTDAAGKKNSLKGTSILIR